MTAERSFRITSATGWVFEKVKLELDVELAEIEKGAGGFLNERTKIYISN